MIMSDKDVLCKPPLGGAESHSRKILTVDGDDLYGDIDGGRPVKTEQRCIAMAFVFSSSNI